MIFSSDSIHTLENFRAKNKTKSISIYLAILLALISISTIANADTIIVMENGTIVESGTHSELINQKGKYFGLWTKQSLV